MNLDVVLVDSSQLHFLNEVDAQYMWLILGNK